MCGSRYRCVPVSTAYAQPPRPNTQRPKLNFRRSRNWPMCELQVRKYLAIAYTAAIEDWIVVSQKTTARYDAILVEVDRNALWE